MKAAYWLDQNWSTEDRFWFHHASQGTATFPVPYTWYIALEQPGLRLFSRPGLLSDSAYLERFGFIPSPKTVHGDAGYLRRFGFVNSDAKTEPAPETVAGLKPRPADNVDGLPVGFARMTASSIRQPAALNPTRSASPAPAAIAEASTTRGPAFASMAGHPCWSCASSSSRPGWPSSTP